MESLVNNINTLNSKATEQSARLSAMLEDERDNDQTRCEILFELDLANSVINGLRSNSNDENLLLTLRNKLSVVDKEMYSYSLASGFSSFLFTIIIINIGLLIMLRDWEFVLFGSLPATIIFGFPFFLVCKSYGPPDSLISERHLIRDMMKLLENKPSVDNKVVNLLKHQINDAKYKLFA